MIHAFIRRAAFALATLTLVSGSALPAAAVPRSQTAVLSGGCFWGMELVFESLRGVTRVVSGYAGGSKQDANYQAVSTGTTGHAESVEISYDPGRISYRQLLDVFLRVAHDPTQLNRQDPDVGSQYRSAVFYTGPEQKRIALDEIAALTASKSFPAPVVTAVVPLRGFFAAEEYHQHFAQRNPGNAYIAANDAPKVALLRARYPKLVAGTR